MRILAFLTTILFIASAQADWQLDNKYSSLSFVSVKKEHIAEVHYFKDLSGTVVDSGEVSFNVALASVDTNIEVRDTRMKEMLFEVGLYPTATFTSRLPSDLVNDLAAGDSKRYQLMGNIALHGVSQQVSADVLITRVGKDKITVATTKPFIINAGDYKLAQGVEKLREIAGLPGITLAVPVTFSLTFVKA